MSKKVLMSNDEILQYYQDALDARSTKARPKESEVLKRLKRQARPAIKNNKVDSLPPTPQMSDKATRVGMKVVKDTAVDVAKGVMSGKPITPEGVIGSAIKSTKKAIKEEMVYSGGNTTGLSKPNMGGGNTGGGGGSTGGKPPSEDPTSEFNPQSTDVRGAFAPIRATPAREIFMPLAPVKGGFKLSNGRATTDFVPLVQRSNATYLGWSNRFNAVPSGSII